MHYHFAVFDKDKNALRAETENGLPSPWFSLPLKTPLTSLLAPVDLLLIGLAPVALAEAPRPNVLFILADDLGYGDIGILHQNARPVGSPRISTPNIDALAAGGIILRNHTAASPVCSPSRASLLTGRHQGQCGVRGNVAGGAVLPAGHTIGSLLKSAGYGTHVVGKWGVSSSNGTLGHPLDRGFDTFYGFVNQTAAHEHYPGNNGEIWDGRAPVTSGLTDLYSTDLFTARAKKVIADHVAATPEKPFFLYLNYTAPHAKLQVGPGPYPAGGGLTGGLQWPLARSGTKDSYLHPSTESSWPADARRYASMVRRMDEAVADLRQLLADLNIAGNTLIVLTSDNGPPNDAGNGGTITYDPTFFQSSGPFDDIKRGLLEGGVRVPAIVCWPSGTPPGRVSDHANTAVDWLPTFCELAGVPAPAHQDGISIAPLLRGTSGQRQHRRIYHEYIDDSATSALTNAVLVRKGYPSGTNRGFQQSVRAGGLKALRYRTTSQSSPVRVFQFLSDPFESTDLAGSAPDLAETLRKDLVRMRSPHPTWPTGVDTADAPALTGHTVAGAGLSLSVHNGATPYVADPASLGAGIVSTVSAPSAADASSPDAATLVYRGLIQVPASGLWNFHLRTDSGAVLRIHDAIVIEDDFARSGAEAQGEKRLEAGQHPITIVVRRPAGAERDFSFEWSGPGVSREPVPATAFSREGPPPPPEARPDSASTSRGQSVVLDVMANDLPFGGVTAGLSILSAGPAIGGNVTIGSGGFLQFTPDPAYTGLARFSYTLTDGLSTSASEARVRVTFRDNTVWMPFNENSGNRTLESGGELAGLLEGFSGTGWITGRHGSALRFNGSSRRVVLNGYTGITGNASRTVSAWIKTTSNGPIMAWGGSGNGTRWIFRIQEPNGSFVTGAPRVEVQGGYLIGSTPVNDGQWHHVAAVLPDGATNVTNVRLYVNGLRETVSASQSMAINTSGAQNVWIGNDMQSRWFNGDLDEVRIESGARSDAGIAELASDGTSVHALWHRTNFGNETPDWRAVTTPDGQPRLWHYFTGADPRNSAPKPAWEFGAGVLRVEFPKTIEAPLGWRLESSTDLVQWNPVPASIIASVPDNFTDHLTVEVPVPPTLPARLFHRIAVFLE